MEAIKKQTISIETTVNAPVENVWEYWSKPEHVIKWNQASDDWHTTRGENDLRKGGKFSFIMEAKDGSFGFDFGGTYDDVQPNKYIEYTLGDGRKVEVYFESRGNTTHIKENFEAETINPIDMQRTGWQAILDNFRKYVEKIN
jgi:uncharacterized protein YndB with AHSA1/START domain